MSLTRRDFLASSAVAAFAGALGRPDVANAWRRAQTPAPQAQPVFTPIRRNVGFFTMRGGTIGYVIDRGGVAVVDSQYPAEGKACLDGLNARSNGRPVDVLINTHHHADHTGGNISFKGAARHVVSQTRAAELMRNPPGAQPPAGEQLYPDTTFTDTWTADVGGERLRAKFFPDAKQSHAINYAVVRDGRVALRRALILQEEGKPGLIGSSPRFQVTPDNRLFVICYVTGKDTDGKAVSENRLFEIGPDGEVGTPATVPFKKAFTAYFTATVRGGSPPSNRLELLGQREGEPLTMSYARVRLW